MTDSVASAPAKDGTFDELIFKRELNEVYLLLDFISGRHDAHIWNLDVDIPAKNGLPNQKATAFDLYRLISTMRYPPRSNGNTGANGGETEDKAYNATVLLYVKDKLNSIAAPARGMTIAYTYIYLAEELPMVTPVGSSEPVEQEQGQTKASVARDAFPGLAASARRLRTKRNIISIVGSLVFVLATYLLCWTVYGSVIIKRFEEDRQSTMELEKNIATQLVADKAGGIGKDISGSVAHVCCWDTVDKLSVTAQGLCGNWSYYQARFNKAIADAGAYGRQSRFLTFFLPTAQLRPKQEPSPPCDGCEACPARTTQKAATVSTSTPAPSDDFRQEDVQSIGLIASVYSTYVLPLFFGFVGTVASFLRDTGNKSLTNTLAPRDESLAGVRLLLGAIAGIAVGLFYSPTQSAQQVTSGFGVLTLSASAIAFIAGYAADVFFNFLDNLSTRLFNLSGGAGNTR
jgi:hypothetical protein